MNKSANIGGILAKLFKKILLDLGGDTPIVQHNMIENYLLSQKTGEKPALRGNLKTYIESPTLTFKRFVELMDVFKLRKFTICITIHHANGKNTEHAIKVNINSNDKETTDE